MLVPFTRIWLESTSIVPHYTSHPFLKFKIDNMTPSISISVVVFRRRLQFLFSANFLFQLLIIFDLIIIVLIKS